MEVMHERVAGLDVHKATIVACVRVMSEERSSASAGHSRQRRLALRPCWTG